MLLLRRFGTIETNKFSNLSELLLLNKKLELKPKYPELNVLLNNPRIHEYDSEFLESEFRRIHLETYGDWGAYNFCDGDVIMPGISFAGISFFVCCILRVPEVFAFGIPMVTIGLTFCNLKDAREGYRKKIISSIDDYSVLLSVIQKEKENNRLLEDS